MAATVMTAGVTPALGDIAGSTTQVSVDGSAQFQRMDGFGFAEAFQRAAIIHGLDGLSPANQQAVVNLLFSQQDGAGFSILRLGIGSSPDDVFDHMESIEPVSPGSPAATPVYQFDGSDNSQVWLAQQAQDYGVHQIYADAWSAPGFMKTTGTDNNGGWLCGVPGETCASGDWRQAYANYLVQYIKDYQSVGVHLSAVGFLNEPEIGPSYAGMFSTPQQAADFIPILGRTLRANHLDTKLACCDSEGWGTGAGFTNTILSDPQAAPYLDIVTSHGYTAPPNVPLTSQRPVWESEWAVFDPWDPAWDDGSDASGMTWAQNVMTALTSANVNAFLYWWGASASTANSGLIRLNGDTVTPSGRFWALGAFSRFIRPGAVRIGSTNDTSNGVETAAFRNVDGQTVVDLLNTSTTAEPVQVGFSHLPQGGFATPYLTDASDNIAAQQPVQIQHGQASLTLPPRSIVSLVVHPSFLP